MFIACIPDALSLTLTLMIFSFWGPTRMLHNATWFVLLLLSGRWSCDIFNLPKCSINASVSIRGHCVIRRNVNHLRCQCFTPSVLCVKFIMLSNYGSEFWSSVGFILTSIRGNCICVIHWFHLFTVKIIYKGIQNYNHRSVLNWSVHHSSAGM